jgi:hypothetical protein
MTLPDFRPPPKNPATAIAQSRNWFLFNIDGEPMVYRRKAVWFTPLGTNERQFVGDDFEPNGHLMTAKLPTTVRTIFVPAWAECVKPPLFAGA